MNFDASCFSIDSAGMTSISDISATGKELLAMKILGWPKKCSHWAATHYFRGWR